MVETLPMPRYYIDENNSGGSFWLSRKQYEKMFNAGWKLDETAMERKRGSGFMDVDKPFDGDGDDVPYGWRRHSVFVEADSMRDAIESFEAATGQDFWAEGCNCCGVPFSMSSDDDSEYMSGSDAIRTSRAPW
jgi:hypothetical protein